MSFSESLPQNRDALWSSSLFHSDVHGHLLLYTDVTSDASRSSLGFVNTTIHLVNRVR